ncbi:MAG: AtpZ/AtpI family protein [Clostridia bacterium]|nr:AtpZ/AtpI family protein [Clostridiales bacterium]MDU2292601.1 AtpZ/AtpI family protein [Peptococcus niger]MDU7243797.1 AtpZ/AtpI family protein [Clostridiales bacterium]MDU7505260.1 AtpZ/AtpI family protein [Clostridia bacterium]
MTNGTWRPKLPRRPGSDAVWVRAFNVALSFGVTLGASLFIMWHIGQWLDDKFGTYFVFTFIGVVMAIITGFRFLLRELAQFEQAAEAKKSTDRLDEKGDGDE